MTDLLHHLRPATLAQLAAELIVDHAEEMDAGQYDFHTEAAAAAYRELLAAGHRLVREEYFWTLIEEALAREGAAAGITDNDLPY